MSKKSSKKSKALSVIKTSIVQKQYVDELDTNPEYSLDVDPTGDLKMPQQQKDFIRHYVNFKSILTAAELAGVDEDTAKTYFVAYDTQLEIRRINRALCHRQFAAKLVTVDEIGGYLSSLLTGDNVALADQLKTPEKLRVIELLLKINELKAASVDDPSAIIHSDIETQIKQLSVSAIERLLAQNRVDINEKNEIISELDDGTLSIEEKAYLASLPVSELLNLLDENKKGGDD